LTRDDVTIVAGGLGVPASALETVVGCALCYDLNVDEPITFGMIEFDEHSSGSARSHAASRSKPGDRK
jgi:hypothetical protein